MTHIIVDNRNLIYQLDTLANYMNKPERLTRALANVLVTHTLLNFQMQGRPAWAGLSLKTEKSYAKKGFKLNSILQKTGALKRSVFGDYDASSATIHAGVGDSGKYAAIHQFGGMAGRNRKVVIPARPYLPIDKDGKLQHEAELSIEDRVIHFWTQYLTQ